MADPLSLNDLPLKQDAVNAVEVVVGAGDEGAADSSGKEEVIPPSTVEWPTDSDEDD